MKKDKLLNENELEWSTVVANNTMNRERKATGINSYEKDIKLDPIQFLNEKLVEDKIYWTDLCCGSGNAIIQASKYFENRGIGKKIYLQGIDLVDYFPTI